MTSNSFSTFECLPTDIANKILQQLSLRSIAALSLTSKACFNLCRSDSLWRIVCRKLVGEWVHSPMLNKKNSRHFDWTINFDPWLSTYSKLKNPSHLTRQYGYSLDGLKNYQDESYATWYQLATRFLIPNLNYLGWHASDRPALGRLILVTFDPKTCELVGEEIIALNLFDINLYNHPHSGLYRAILPSTRPAHPPHISRLSRRMDSYRVPPQSHSPYAGLDVDLFKPAYVALPYFRLRHSLSFNRPLPMRIQPRPFSTPLSNTTKFPSPDTLYVIRSPHFSLDSPLSTYTDPKPNITPAAFTLAFLPSLTPQAVPIPNHPRIRYQTPPTNSTRNSVTFLHHGHRHVCGSGIEECFFPILGLESKGLEGIWVGYYGPLHGPEFGHLRLIDDELSFIKLTGDKNVPSGIISWKTYLNGIEPGLEMDKKSWRMKGLGKVANVGYEYPVWIETWVSLIIEEEEEEEENELKEKEVNQIDLITELNFDQIHSIQVHWTELNHVSSFYRVRF
ncbi:hypothetical protein CROQUDRAFT_659346 [Cronartium quercuum f. sp. fusiforme G11]|uniref:F-box domain-containing protein n=1 Tax=Cronartium quercuum f. sp. fusiforme G11 TaxID=708437 RepID=A0A9P6NIQ7_9BASI|nr:hypothetical protein CROQUDRAFT_659346 [Cronartium quercuum f. sp. fusiforme G11]